MVRQVDTIIVEFLEKVNDLESSIIQEHIVF